jgi:triosephosphate isomerase
MHVRIAMKRRPLIAANWKMHLGRVEEALALVRRLRPGLSRIDGIDLVLCPPFTVLASMADVLRPTSIALGAQTMHWENRGAHTGDVSPAMLTGLCRYVIVGHSERRASGSKAESDTAVSRKVRAALTHGLIPIICVGEDAARNEAGETDAFVGIQVRAALEGLTADEVRRVVIAYEPIWAIGTGRSATPAGANRTIALGIRGDIADCFDEETAATVRVLYGGSVTADNIGGFMAMPDIDGALVGGASLSPEFVDLVRRAVGLRD